MICGYTCEDLASMFKELKTLGVMVKDLTDKLRKVVRSFLFFCLDMLFVKSTFKIRLFSHVFIEFTAF